MEKRFDNSHYIVFSLVLLVLVMGVISFVRGGSEPAHAMTDAERIARENQRAASCEEGGGVYADGACVMSPRQEAKDSNIVFHILSEIVDMQGQTIDKNNNGVVDAVDDAAVVDKAMKLDPALANLILECFNNCGKNCFSDVDCGSLKCINAQPARVSCVADDQSVSNDAACGRVCWDDSGCPANLECVGFEPEDCEIVDDRTGAEQCAPPISGCCGRNCIDNPISGKCKLLSNQLSA